MSIIDHFLAIIAPHVCVGCGNEGKLLCDRCSDLLLPVPSRCYRCHRVTNDSRTCPACRKQSRLAYVRVATSYEAIAKALIWKLKFGGAQAAAEELGHRLAALLADYSYTDSVLIVPVPTATSRARQRGYDQAILLARALSRSKHLRLAKVLHRHGQTHQRGANRHARVVQLQSAFRVGNAAAIRGAHVLLVDDVLTTGSTLEAAAKALKAAGARTVGAIVFAQA